MSEKEFEAHCEVVAKAWFVWFRELERRATLQRYVDAWNG